MKTNRFLAKNIILIYINFIHILGGIIMILNTIWEQQYNPMGNIWLSAGVAALPIVIF